MGRRRHDNINAVSAFFDGFNQSYDTVGRVLQDIEMSKVANAKPEEETVTEQTMQGFQGQAPDASGATSQYDLADAPTTQRKVTKFLGQTFETPPSTEQIERVRSGRMADALAKFDPRAGMQMRRELTREDREGERYALEKKRGEREERQATQAETDAQTLRDIDADMAQRFNTRLSNPDGTQRPATVDDHVWATQQRAAALLQKGRTKEAGEVMNNYAAQVHVKLKMEEAERNEALKKIQPGDYQAVAAYYNRFIPDGAHVQSIERGKNGALVIKRTGADGQPMPDQTLAGGDRELQAMLQQTVNTDAMRQFSVDEFNRGLALRRDARDGAQLGIAQAANTRAQEVHQAGAGERGVAQQLASLQQVLLSDKASKSEKESAASRITELQTIQQMGKGGHAVPAELQIAKAILASGAYGVKDMAGAIEATRNARGKSRQEFIADYVTKNGMPGEDPQAVLQAANTLADGLYGAKGQGAAPPAGAPPEAAINHLRQNPGLRAAFEAKYGAGSAAKYLN